MKTKFLLCLMLLGLTTLSAQNYFEICFAGDPEMVLVENLTKGESLSMEGNDTLHLILDGTKVNETDVNENQLIIRPNPVNQRCHFNFEKSTYGRMDIFLLLPDGTLLFQDNMILSPGIHHFELSGLSTGAYLLYIKTENAQFCERIISFNNTIDNISLRHVGFTFNKLKSSSSSDDYVQGDEIPLNLRSIHDMEFTAGDLLRFTGFASGSENDVIEVSPAGDQTITFHFCFTPEPPTPGTNLPSPTQIVWNWNEVEGATGYKYNLVDDYNTATDNGASNKYKQSDLECNTGYTLYIWSFNECGHSLSLVMSQNTSPCPIDCGSPVSFLYNNSTVTYGTVQSANNKCWLDRNLGANRVATGSTDEEAYGHLFQWGRNDDGHQVRTSITTTTLSNSDVPGHAHFILSPNNPWDWRSPQNNDLWQGVNSTNNPCPEGFRLPTYAEWEAERESWTSNNAAGAFYSPLKLTVAGYRFNFDGALSYVNSYGYYWSSSVENVYAWLLFFRNGNAYMNDYYRAHGVSVRCIMDE
jgi:uncharacterized protein (TIGR02145 family)